MTHHTTPKDIAKDLGTSAESVVEAVKDSGRVAANGLRDLASDVQNNVASHADAAKDSLADSGQHLADTLRATASKQGEGTLQGAVLGAVAGGVADISETLRDQSLSNIVTNVRGMARRNPGAFILGAAVAGFALARLARPSADPAPGAAATRQRLADGAARARTEALS